jgi:hypothetical protein
VKNPIRSYEPDGEDVAQGLSNFTALPEKVSTKWRTSATKTKYREANHEQRQETTNTDYGLDE